MMKVWNSFSILLVLAMLTLVPAAPVANIVLANPGQDWGVEFVPSSIVVGPNSSFTVNVNFTQWGNEPSDAWTIYCTFNTSMLQVASVGSPALLCDGNAPSLIPGEPGWNNTNGTVHHAYAEWPPINNCTNSTFYFCNITFNALAIMGETQVKFTTINPTKATQAISNGTDVTDWSHVVNLWVIISAGAECCVNMSGNGSVKIDGITKTPPGGCVQDGNLNHTFTVQAYPDGGWQFANWTGDINTTANPTWVNMTGGATATVTAHFAMLDATACVDETLLDFGTLCVGGGNPANKTFTVTNCGGGQFNWTSSLTWVNRPGTNATISWSPTSGGPLGPGSSQTVQVAIDISAATADDIGTYTANISINPNVTVTFYLLSPTEITPCRNITLPHITGGGQPYIYAGESFNVNVSWTTGPNVVSGIALIDNTSVTDINGARYLWDDVVQICESPAASAKQVSCGGFGASQAAYGLNTSATSADTGTYIANISINPNVTVTFCLQGATEIIPCRNITLPHITGGGQPYIYAGESFDVYVSWVTCPNVVSNITLIDNTSVTDINGARYLWDSVVFKGENPAADAKQVCGTGNTSVEYRWYSNYTPGTNMDVHYYVTVPVGTAPGIYNMTVCPDNSSAWIEYYIGATPYTHCIDCDFQIYVAAPVYVEGTVYEVVWNWFRPGYMNIPGNLTRNLTLAGVNVSMVGAESYFDITDATGYYNIAVPPGNYILIASRAGFATETWGTVNITGMESEPVVCDFIGIHGLEPNWLFYTPKYALSYALKAVNAWLVTPWVPEAALSLTEVANVTAMWLATLTGSASVEYLWEANISPDTPMWVSYNVTVPPGTAPGWYNMTVCPDDSDAWLEYYIGETPYWTCIRCDYQIYVASGLPPQKNLSVYLTKPKWNAGETAEARIILKDDNGNPINGLGKIEYRIDSALLNIPLFNQKNYTQTLGNCSGCNITNCGCAVTSMAMILKYFGISLTVPAEHSKTGKQRVGMNPEILDDWLSWKDGYAYDSEAKGYCLIKWGALSSEGVDYIWIKDNPSETGIDPNTYTNIDNALANGHPVIAGVHWESKPENNSHYVVITSRNGSTYNINDPYGGVATTLNASELGSYIIDKYIAYSGIRKSVNPTAPGAYKFYFQVPSEPGEHTLYVRANVGGDTLSDDTSFFVNYAAQKTPVVLVHDYAKDPSSLSALKGRLENDGFEVYLSDYSPGESNCDAMGDIKGYAGKLSDEIANIKKETGADKVDIVGHGMGGLVARWYVEKLNGNTNVRKLILLGTPNNGLTLLAAPNLWDLAVPIPFIVDIIEGYVTMYYGIKENCWEGVYIFKYPSLGKAMEQMYPYNGITPTLKLAQNVHYTNIIGNKPTGFLTLLFPADNDGFVYVDDAYIAGLSPFDEEEFDVDHWELVTDEGVYAKINETLHDDPTLTNETYESESSQPQGLPPVYDTIENVTQLHNLTLSFANRTTLLLVWDEGDLNLTLTTPNGTTVNSTATIDDMNITYYPSDNTTFEGYEIENPLNGSWIANVIPINVSNTNYTLSTSLETNLTLLISPDEYNSYLGEQINLTANLTYFNTSITNASVAAKIIRPDDEVDNITLEEINQSYLGIYNNTNITGQYAIIVTANGTLDGKDFIRQTAISVWVEQLPDLTVENISISNTTPSIGDNVTITAGIKNIGEGNATNATVEFYVDDPVNATAVGEGIVDVESNSTAIVAASWIAEYGTHDIYVVIPASNPFLEENYTNNAASANITVRGPVVNLSSTVPVEVDLYSTFAVEVLVENTGSEELLNASASITLPPGLPTTDPLTANLGSISALGNKTALWNITANQTGLYEITVNLTSANAPTMCISKNISVTDIKISDLQTAPVYCPLGDEVTIKTNVTNLNPGVSYIGLYLNTSIIGPTNTSYLRSNISLLYAASTELLEIPFNETETCGLYSVNVSLFASSILVDSKETTFEVTAFDISGRVYEANASVLGGATIVLKCGNSTVGNTTSNATGYYHFMVNTTGNYTVNATKGGLTYVAKWANVTTNGSTVPCNFTGVDAPYPKAPNVLYCIKCSNLWLYESWYPAGFGLTAKRVSDVLYAWTHPS